MAFFLICGGPRWTPSLAKMTFILKYLLNEHTKFFDNAQQKKLLYDFLNLATFKISDLILCDLKSWSTSLNIYLPLRNFLSTQLKLIVYKYLVHRQSLTNMINSVVKRMLNITQNNSLMLKIAFFFFALCQFSL